MAVLGAAAGLVVPVVGPAATQAILKRAIKLPLELRRTNWFNSLGEGLRELQDRFEGFDPDALGENEEFVSAVYEATHMAMRSSKDEKRENLRNAVLNIALGINLNEVLHGSFLDLIDRFSSTHIQALQLYDNPQTMSSMAGPGAQIIGNVKEIVEQYLHKNGVDMDAAKRVNSDLEQEGMIVTTYQMTIGQGEDPASVLYPVGKHFLKFISKPIPRK